MATLTQQHGFEVYTIHSADDSAHASFVPEKGGVGSSLRVNAHGQPRELLYCHDFFWDKTLPDLPGGWPFLFPICARLERGGQLGRYLYEGQVYNMPIHGVGWWSTWQVSATNNHDELILVLRDSAKTRQMYPFQFEVQLHYQLSANSLMCKQQYHNHSAKPMPYYAGFHPYFAVADKAQTTLTYKPIKRFVYNDQLTDIIGEQALFTLPSALDNPDLNEQLTAVADDKIVQLNFPDNFMLQLQADRLFPYLQCYTMTDKPFFCIEPWMSFPNALNTVSGVRWLAPGEREHSEIILTWQPRG